MRVTTEEQLQSIWERAEEQSIDTLRTVDQWGNPITIFSGWGDVEKIANIVWEVLPQSMIDDYAPSWEHLPEDRRPNPNHHIEWAIGEFGFDGQYSTCGNCGVAIDTTDYHPRFYVDYDQSDIICADCLKNNPGYAEDYLSYCARHMGDDYRARVFTHLVDPAEYGYIPLNPYSAWGEYGYGDFLIKYEGIDNFSYEDHPEWRNGLTYGDDKDITRLARACQSIDPNVQMLCAYHPTYSSTYVFWAKWADNNDPAEDDPKLSRDILNYTIGLILRKYGELLATRGK